MMKEALNIQQMSNGVRWFSHWSWSNEHFTGTPFDCSQLVACGPLSFHPYKNHK